MPTQEERIAALEQKTTAHIQEMDENFTIMVGVIRHQGQDIKRIFQRLESVDQRLDAMDESLNSLKHQFETRFDELTSLLTQILARLPKTP